EATGREHLGLAVDGTRFPPAPHDATNASQVGVAHPGDGKAVGRYQQEFVYDEVGNLLQQIHRNTDPTRPGWTRTCTYGEASWLEPGKTSNRLSHTDVGGQTEPLTYDVHG